MAVKTRLAQWLYSQAEYNQLSFKNLTWPKKFGLDFYDYSCEISISGRIFEGRGTDSDEELAIEKASAEAIERAICWFYRIDTDGVAVHTNLASAEENALLEAKERFLLSFHLDNGVPLKRLKISSEFEIDFNKFEKQLDKPIRTTFLQTQIIGNHATTICILESEKQGFVGLSCSLIELPNFTKAFIECLRNFSAYQENPVKYQNAVLNNNNLWCGSKGFTERVLALGTTESHMNSCPRFRTKSEILEFTTIPGFSGTPANAVRVKAVEA